MPPGCARRMRPRILNSFVVSMNNLDYLIVLSSTFNRSGFAFRLLALECFAIVFYKGKGSQNHSSEFLLTVSLMNASTWPGWKLAMRLGLRPSNSGVG